MKSGRGFRVWRQNIGLVSAGNRTRLACSLQTYHIKGRTLGLFRFVYVVITNNV